MLTAPSPEARRSSTRPAGVVGLVFDVEEFAVHDGPGIRTTVFLKGCPLRCTWCHNPEGLAFLPEPVLDAVRCEACGHAVDVREGRCEGCGRSVERVPLRVRHTSGTWYRVEELAGVLLANREVLAASGGGITLSGGEPLSQAEFVLALVEAVRPLHVAIETSGHVPESVFQRVVDRVDLVMIDIKHADAQAHRRYTGVNNAGILRNVDYLCHGYTDFVVRIPLIPGVNDSAENLGAVADLLVGAPRLQRVELLPYNTMAGAKYAKVGRRFQPNFDTERPPNADPRPFLDRDIPCEVL